MTTRSERSNQKRRQIRAAAQRLFLASGVAATSMDAITLEAGVSKQTVYAYYPSKDALLADVLETLMAQRTAAWDAEHQPAHPLRTRAEVATELTGYAESVVDTLLQPEYLGLARVIVAESGRNPKLGALFREAVSGPIIAGTARLVARGIAGGALRPVPVEDAGRLLVGSLLTYTLLDGLLRPDGPRQPPAGAVARLVALLCDGLAAR
ncbi:TetR/AcrR family transcriptional regulator [Plantactinospora sp. GCM10030261]|uniref:TetR/AcrR family transcriptional regulator n=1 Tax=Plantactinospora sp. GCM10030261 TaxID=3273420 RepID=UPI003615206A